jgi:uncharacterized membrane protein
MVVIHFWSVSLHVMKNPLRPLVEFEAHHRVAVALVVAALAFGVSARWLRPQVSLIVSWDAFALCSLVLAWAGMVFTDARTRVREAHLQDSNRAAICGCVVFAAVAGLFGAGLLLGSAKGLAGSEASRHVALAALTVVSSWLLVHTVLALHYAHICYHLAEESPEKPPDVGVVFPNEPQPDFLDFAYFSFVIGMTCQVSDVQITSRRIRRIALLHGLLSFGFNTVIVALSLNLASTLL